ncbi:hypothetical protein H9C73_15915 [Marinobacterium sp. AK62]|uniref:HNH endonuclease n=1 Tax=Marinobacterium alkalitolerans TaxID=1542925 RepID=A0ABS3ZET2_9GAMM|nr:hypothetical protein [Marinobacterium alkalitolerans]MBP0050208.1 hypothetical protein [Marinobacterium alkalitolerans]
MSGPTIESVRASIQDHLKQLKCSVCGEALAKEIDGKILVEKGELHAEWGYASNNDGVVHHLDLCESCFHLALSTLKSRAVKTLDDDTAVSESFGIENHIE